MLVGGERVVWGVVMRVWQGSEHVGPLDVLSTQERDVFHEKIVATAGDNHNIYICTFDYICHNSDLSGHHNSIPYYKTGLDDTKC